MPFGCICLGSATAGELKRAAKKVPQSEETKKILKKLQMPDVEAAARPTDCLSKAVASLVKRLRRLTEIKTEVVDSPNGDAEISKKSFGLRCIPFSALTRLTQKIDDLYTRMDELMDDAVKLQQDVAIDGPSDEPGPHAVAARERPPTWLLGRKRNARTCMTSKSAGRALRLSASNSALRFLESFELESRIRRDDLFSYHL